MNKLVSLSVMLAASAAVHAVTEKNIWSYDLSLLPQISLKEKPLPITSSYLLKATSLNNMHQRYQLFFEGIPVFGRQIIVHKNKPKPLITGTMVSHIEKEVKNTEAALSPEQAEQPILASQKSSTKFKQTEKVIFIDENKKAHLVYHLSFYTHDSNNRLTAPNYMIDANSGKILYFWNDLHHQQLGQGLGGNIFDLPYRKGSFQYGNLYPNYNSFDKFDVRIKKSRCIVTNQNISVINLRNLEIGYDAFPITIEEEQINDIVPFSYSCNKKTNYVNQNDDGFSPVNDSLSPINDTMFFAQKTIEMYQKQYNVEAPIGNDLPIRAYTHIDKMDNAFALPSIRRNGKLIAHQQIAIGNGDTFLTAPAQTVIAHELSHNFTAVNSKLIYYNQSGGLNESFSDMAAIALEDYLQNFFPWYWDKKDWSLGREAGIGGEPLRYMDYPTRDGVSIDHAKHFRNGMNVHYSSGVFNKAFYLLSTQPDWSIAKAFQIMIDANQNYWEPSATFTSASCGVIQAAIDRHYDHKVVIDVFNQVGVNCPQFNNNGIFSESTL